MSEECTPQPTLEIPKSIKKAIDLLRDQASSNTVTCVWAPDTTAVIEGDEEAHEYKLTDPPHYAIVTYVKFDKVNIIGLFPNINPLAPEDKVSSIACAPNNVGYEGLVTIFEGLLKVKPPEIVDAEIIHLSEEQLATILACELDQDQVFGFIYAGEGERNRVFDLTTKVTVVKDIDDMPKGEVDAILSEQRSVHCS